MRVECRFRVCEANWRTDQLEVYPIPRVHQSEAPAPSTPDTLSLLHSGLLGFVDLATMRLMAGDSSRRHRWWLLVLKIAVVALVVWGVHATVRDELAKLRAQEWSIDWAWMIAAGLLYLLSLLPFGVYWHDILIAFGQNPGRVETLRAYYIGHLGKYVPGKALVVVIRTWLIHGGRVDATAAAVSVVLETLTMMSVGASLSALILWVAFPGQVSLTVIAVILAVLAGVPTLPPVVRFLLQRLPQVGTKPESESSTSNLQLDGITVGLMAGGWTNVVMGWCLMGLSLWATLMALGAQQLDPVRMFALCTASVSLAVVTGFISLMPGGALIRELVLTQLLAHHFAPGIGLVSAVLLRMIWLVSELLISGILYIVRPAYGGAGENASGAADVEIEEEAQLGED